MKPKLLAGVLLCAACHAAGPWGTLHKVSVAVLAAASAADVGTSLGGKPETNSILRSPNGTFGARGVAIKSGIVGGAALAGWLVMRKHPAWTPAVTLANFGMAATTGAIAERNMRFGRIGSTQ